MKFQTCKNSKLLFLLCCDYSYCFLLLLYSSQNSSLDHLLNRLPGFLEELYSQNNVKVNVCLSVFSNMKHLNPFSTCIYNKCFVCLAQYSCSYSQVSYWKKILFAFCRCGTITKDGMPWCHLSTWWTTACWERVCHQVQRGEDTASPPTTTRSTSPRSNSPKWPC